MRGNHIFYQKIFVNGSSYL